MKQLVAILFLFFAVVGIAQAADRASVSVTHAFGTVSIPLAPERVVVMDFGMLDTLDALGIQARLAVPKGNLPAYLAKYGGQEYTDVGGLKEFNLETINAFKPELIIISARQQDYYKELSSIAPVYFVDNLSRDSLASARKNITAIGAIFGMKENVDHAWDILAQAVARVREKAVSHNKRALVLLTNDGKISAYGSGSRFGIIYDDLGLPQADPAIKVGIHGQLVNYEYLAMVNPDIIFVVDRSAAVGGNARGIRLLDNALVAKTNASKNDRIVALPPDYWYLSGGGLQSLARMVDDIENALGK